MASETNSSQSIQAKRTDPAWKYNYLQDPKDSNSVTCKFCGKVTKGGIFRAKHHQTGGHRNAKQCQKCPPEVREELKSYMEAQKAKKSIVFDQYMDLEQGDDEDLEEPVAKKRSSLPLLLGNNAKKLKSNVSSSPLELLRAKDKGKSVALRQTSINEAYDKELLAATKQEIARFFYQAGISFNCARLDSFKRMLQAAGNYGPHIQPPSYHEIRVPLLNKEVQLTKELMKDHQEEWKRYGCSIMSDGWTDRRQRTLINFMVNCSKGTMFVESVDASSYMKTGSKLFDLLDKFVLQIGEENVIQIITDNGSNYVQAGKFLMLHRPHLFWTPCAAHCLDLMLEDIGKIEKVKRTIARGVFLVGFIYNHGGVLSMMREFTNNKELARHGVTRFATTFLTLQSLQKKQACLRQMFTSEKWTKSKWANEAKGKRAFDVVFMTQFWNDVYWTLKVMSPLVQVLRLVDNEKKPAMGYIYEAMERAKEAIAKAFNHDEAEYKRIYEIINRRWDCQLHHPLHAAGYYFNPEFYCTNKDIENDIDVQKGLVQCIKRLTRNKDEQDLIMLEMIQWVNQVGMFSDGLAVRARGKMAPAEWWKLFGKQVPHVQKLAIKVLSLACSSSGCERNWSMFEHIHSKKRNRLEHKKLKDIVYVKYNQTLKMRQATEAFDPISLKGIDDSNEWLVGKSLSDQDLVFPNEDLTWRDVEIASGVGEGRSTRKSKAKKPNNPSSSSSMALEVEDERSDDDDSSGESTEGELEMLGENENSDCPSDE